MLPVSANFIEGIQGAAFSSEDVLGGFGPYERLRLGVVEQQVVVDRLFQVIDAGVAAPADASCGDLGEEALDQVHPRRAGRREMQLEARMFLQPGRHLRCFVGRIVVEHDMDVARLEDSSVDAAQERQELPGAVAGHAVANDDAGLHIEGGEQRGRAMALVVVGHRGGAPLLERQPRLGPVERLDLRSPILSNPWRSWAHSRPRRAQPPGPADRGKARRSP